MLFTAHRLGYKTLTHEQNAYPASPHRLWRGRRPGAAGEGRRQNASPEGVDYRVTGNPLRESILHTDRALPDRCWVWGRGCASCLSAAAWARRKSTKPWRRDGLAQRQTGRTPYSCHRRGGAAVFPSCWPETALIRREIPILIFGSTSTICPDALQAPSGHLRAGPSP